MGEMKDNISFVDPLVLVPLNVVIVVEHIQC